MAAKKGKKLEHGCLIKWRTRLEKARERGHFTAYDADLASTWTVCAVGEASKLNPQAIEFHPDRLMDGPTDEKLWKLGVDFSDAVVECTQEYDPTRHQFKAVESCLNKIEKRLEQLCKD